MALEKPTMVGALYSVVTVAVIPHRVDVEWVRFTGHSDGTVDVAHLFIMRLMSTASLCEGEISVNSFSSIYDTPESKVLFQLLEVVAGPSFACDAACQRSDHVRVEVKKR